MNIINTTIHIFKSSADKRYFELKIESHISLMNILKIKGPKVDSYGTPDLTTYEKERVPEILTEDCLWVS
jgi:hypothetical protein